jgi:hypothetical protein
MKLKLPNVSSPRGAPMGRQRVLPFQYMGTDPLPIKMHLIRLKWVDGDYDQGGAYWGRGSGNDYVYWASGADDATLFVRATGRAMAKKSVRETFPRATFFN